MRLIDRITRAAVRIGFARHSTALLETTGRKSGLPRVTPLTNGLDGNVFWIVTEHGHNADYVRNIEAEPHVRVRVGNGWRAGSAQIVNDNPATRLQRIAALNHRSTHEHADRSQDQHRTPSHPLRPRRQELTGTQWRSAVGPAVDPPSRLTSRPAKRPASASGAIIPAPRRSARARDRRGSRPGSVRLPSATSSPMFTGNAVTVPGEHLRASTEGTRCCTPFSSRAYRIAASTSADRRGRRAHETIVHAVASTPKNRPAAVTICSRPIVTASRTRGGALGSTRRIISRATFRLV